MDCQDLMDPFVFIMIISCAEPCSWVEQQDVRGGSSQPRSAKGPASKSKDDGARRPREESLHILFNVDKLVKFLAVKNATSCLGDPSPDLEAQD